MIFIYINFFYYFLLVVKLDKIFILEYSKIYLNESILTEKFQNGTKFSKRKHKNQF